MASRAQLSSERVKSMAGETSKTSKKDTISPAEPIRRFDLVGLMGPPTLVGPMDLIFFAPSILHASVVAPRSSSNQDAKAPPHRTQADSSLARRQSSSRKHWPDQG
jgi:hypothetical protein